MNTIQWARKSYEKQITESSKLPRPFSSASSSSFTRSQSAPYNSDVCFFCDKIGTRRDPLTSCRTTGASLHLHTAIEKSKNGAYRVKLNTALNPTDAHAIDVQYHNKCWSHNVTHVLRKVDPECEERETADEVAADIEFISLVEETSLDGMVLSMTDLHATYINIRTSNCVRHPDCSHKKVKMLIEAEIPDVDFHASKQKNVSQKLSIKGGRDVAMQNKFDSQMNTVAADSSDVRFRYHWQVFWKRETNELESF